MAALDITNKKILEILTRNGRKAYKLIADELNLSESTVRKRVAKMIEKQIIDKFTIDINPESIGKNVTAFLTVVPSAQSNIKELSDRIMLYSAVTEAFYMSGKCGLLLKVQVSELLSLDELIENIRNFSKVSEIESCIVLRTLK
ncbi:MAG: Lrp/AsnC family transcriptional regulator [Candidatus Helarchaeota archaeon]|nr:Lrp/AsnC family transcriptional regulator [Candidatus Helarchaeota archaeon]